MTRRAIGVVLLAQAGSSMGGAAKASKPDTEMKGVSAAVGSCHAQLVPPSSIQPMVGVVMALSRPVREKPASGKKRIIR